MFGAAITFTEDQGLYTFSDVRSEAWYRKSRMPMTREGVVPFLHYVIRQKGKVELGSFSCAMCHTRVMPGGGVLNGAQGNFPFSQAAPATNSANPRIPADFLFLINRGLYAMPWLNPDPIDRQRSMSPQQVDAMYGAMPPGVVPRHRSSPFSPVQVPDLIGIRDRRYLDHTGLVRHDSPVDLMRYAAMNQGADSLSSYDGFIPADLPNFKRLPDPGDPIAVGGRYSDDQLHALALYLYSLQPPAQP